MRTFNFPPKKAIGNKVLKELIISVRVGEKTFLIHTYKKKEMTIINIFYTCYFYTDFALLSCRLTDNVVNALIFPLTGKKT